MNNISVILIAIFFASGALSGQSLYVSLSRTMNDSVQQLTGIIVDEEEGKALLALNDLDLLCDNQDDPAYKAYREAYELILDEDWNEARKKFEAVISNYPKSDYLDDAAYWHAYAMRHLDEKKAIEEYKKFLKKFSHSSYYDDALADLNELDPSIVISTSGDSISVITTTTNSGYAYTITPMMKRVETQMRRAQRAWRRGLHSWSISGVPLRVPRGLSEEEKLDRESELRLEALYALGETKEDEKSFQVLKEVALDKTQSPRLREAALQVLTDYKKFDVVSIFLQVAKTDTSPALQSAAVDFLTEHIKDKNRSVETLIELFHAIPKNRSEQRETIFYSIAEVGNEKAIDFLAGIAKTDNDYELRKQAIYYLGSIGSEKARAVLYDILKGK